MIPMKVSPVEMKYCDSCPLSSGGTCGIGDVCEGRFGTLVIHGGPDVDESLAMSLALEASHRASIEVD